MINSCKIILEKNKNIYSKNHCEIQVRTILVCALYSIKYGTFSKILRAQKTQKFDQLRPKKLKWGFVWIFGDFLHGNSFGYFVKNWASFQSSGHPACQLILPPRQWQGQKSFKTWTDVFVNPAAEVEQVSML